MVSKSVPCYIEEKTLQVKSGKLQLFKYIGISIQDFTGNSYYKRNPGLFVQLQNVLNRCPVYSVSAILGKDCNKALKDMLVEMTQNMPFVGHTLNERLYWVLNDLYDFPTCRTPDCINGHPKLDDAKIYFKGLAIGYQGHCCNKCAQLDPVVTGVKKNTTLIRHGDGNFRNIDKARQTNLKHYGISHAMKSDEFKFRRIEKNRRLYGVDWYVMTDDFKQKSAQTLQENYGTGVQNPFQAEAVKQQLRQTLTDKYGVDNPTKNNDICRQAQQAAQDTMLKRYGVKYSAQNHDIFVKMRKKYCFNNICFDSFPEIAYYIWLTDNNIAFQYQPNIQFQYEFAGQLHVYHPDFLLIDSNQLVEIKNSNSFVDGKMICLFDRKLDGLYEAKHQCMIANDVKIMLDAEYSKYVKYAEGKFGKDFRLKCKDQLSK